MESKDQATAWMARALALAERGRTTVTPNPLVGCVIVRDQKVLGEGWHKQAGQGHAEVEAVKNAVENGNDISGADCYVTLEPCSHTGRTPPCAQLLIDNKVGRVFFAARDPNPLVAGRGLAMLEAKGIATHGPILEAQALWQNRGFFKAMQHKRPWVMLKQAMSLDGRIAMASGESEWITGPAARADVQRLRAGCCAMLTGVGTVLYDNPSLTVRDHAALGMPPSQILRQPAHYILCGSQFSDLLAKSGTLRLFQTPDTKLTILLDEKYFTEAAEQHFKSLQATWPREVVLEKFTNFDSLFAQMSNEQIRYLMVEGGGRLAGSLIESDAIDELMLYQADTLLGASAQPAFNFSISDMTQQKRLQLHSKRKVGDDTRLQYLLRKA